MKPLKTFEDLVFQKHAIAIEAEECLKKDKSLLPLSLFKFRNPLGYSDYPFNRPKRISLSPEWI